MTPGSAAAGGTPSDSAAQEGEAEEPRAEPEPRRPMLDIEATFQIESKDVQGSVQKLRVLANKSQGYVVTESITTDQSSSPHAELTLRVPARDAEGFFRALESLGTLRGRNLQAKDVGKQYFDAELRLQMLERSRLRYEELLSKATNVQEIMSVEARLEVLREQIERLKGELRWLRDRAAQATVHVHLYSPAEVESPYEEPSARFYPGLRLSYARNLGGDFGTEDFFGPGLSIRFSRYFSVDVEGLPSVTRGYGGEDFDLFLATVGGEIYSEFLGGGRRRFFNPYLGARAGYARFLTLDQVAVGGVLGLEIIKTPLFVLDLEARSYLLFSSGDQAHALVQPGVSFNVAF